jgi:serine/threonine-protein phosphatase PGAM5
VLTPLGRKQADATGARLRALLGNTPVTITHSTMARAAETAALVGAHFPGVVLRPCELCREGAPARPEPDTWQPKEETVWRDGARIEAAFRKHFYRARPAADAGGATRAEPPVDIIVCHGNVIRIWVLRALQLPPEAWLRIALSNGSITTITLRANGHVSLQGLGDTGHMLPAQITHN